MGSRKPLNGAEELPLGRAALAPWRDVVSSTASMEILSCGHVIVPPSSPVESRRRCEACHLNEPGITADETVDVTSTGDVG